MTVRTEMQASISVPPSDRNAPPSATFPALTGSRARARHAGPTLLAIVWMVAFAFFVFAVAVPTSVMERKAREGRVAQVGP